MAKKNQKQLDEWFFNCSIEEKSIITNYDTTLFNQDNGLQDFINACQIYWDRLLYNEKYYIYKNMKK